MLTTDIILDFESRLRESEATVKEFSSEYCDDLSQGSILALIGIATEHYLRLGKDCNEADYCNQFPAIPPSAIQTAIATSVNNFIDSFCPVTYFLGTMPVEHGGYIFRKEIGRGGSGVVYEVEQINLKRNVAAKVLFVGSGSINDEAVLLGRMDHAGVLAVYDQGEICNHSFIVTKLIHGSTLKKFCRKPPQLSLRRAVSLVVKVLAAVGECHARGIIHWDLKPDNILLNDDQPVVADFGLARHLGTDHLLTTGTPNYMAPELFRKDETISPTQCDVFSIGVILYELLVGSRPYNLSAEGYELVPRKPSDFRSEIDDDLDQICMRAISVSTGNRFQTAQQFRDCLEGWVSAQTFEDDLTHREPSVDSDVPKTDQVVSSKSNLWVALISAAATAVLIGLVLASISWLGGFGN
jgi:serine/threonine-protein kinase